MWANGNSETIAKHVIGQVLNPALTHTWTLTIINIHQLAVYQISIPIGMDKFIDLQDPLFLLKPFEFEWNANKRDEIKKYLNTSSGPSSDQKQTITLTNDQLLPVAFIAILNTIEEHHNDPSNPIVIDGTYHVSMYVGKYMYVCI